MVRLDVQSVLAALKRLSQPRIRKEMSSRHGIETPNAFGVPMRDMQTVAKGLGRNHALAVALWKTDQYEARTVAAFVADPARVTPALMDRWCRVSTTGRSATRWRLASVTDPASRWVGKDALRALQKKPARSP